VKTRRTSERTAAILEQLDRIPGRADAFDPLEWDVDGLPTFPLIYAVE